MENEVKNRVSCFFCKKKRHSDGQLFKDRGHFLRMACAGIEICCHSMRLGPALDHQEACRKALEHSRRAKPLRRAATVSLCRSQCRRGGLDRDSGITELLRQATTGHKLTVAARRSGSAILGCSIYCRLFWCQQCQHRQH